MRMLLRGARAGGTSDTVGAPTEASTAGSGTPLTFFAMQRSDGY